MRLRTLFDPIGKAHAKLAQSGTLRVVAIVGKDGQVIEARILESPSEQLGQFAARLLMVTKFKPALCSGQPCRMEFPLNVQFVRR